MSFPIQISYRNVQASPAVEELIRKGTEKLSLFHHGIVRCRVVLETRHRHLRRGNRFETRVTVTVPGGQVTASSQATLVDPEKLLMAGKRTRRAEIELSHKDLRIAITDAFKTAGRRLQDLVRRQRNQVKVHEQMQGVVAEVFPDRGFGYLETNDRRRVYFHEHSVLNDAYSKLRPGVRVAFAEEKGGQGPQASTVRLMHASRQTKRHSAAA